jgi:hypothetical protein
MRIGWVGLRDPSCLKGQPLEEYLRSMWLSKRDCIGFFTRFLEAELPENEKFAAGYACSNNGTRVFSLKGTIK